VFEHSVKVCSITHVYSRPGVLVDPLYDCWYSESLWLSSTSHRSRAFDIGSNDTMRCESLEKEFESILEAIEWKLNCHTRMFDQCGPPPAYDGVPHLEALVVQAVDS